MNEYRGSDLTEAEQLKAQQLYEQAMKTQLDARRDFIIKHGLEKMFEGGVPPIAAAPHVVYPSVRGLGQNLKSISRR